MRINIFAVIALLAILLAIGWSAPASALTCTQRHQECIKNCASRTQGCSTVCAEALPKCQSTGCWVTPQANKCGYTKG